MHEFIYFNEENLDIPNSKVSELTFNITNKCNLACPYCIVDTHKRKETNFHDAMFKFITLFKDIIKKSDNITITGGEPFIVRDLVFKVIDYINNVDSSKNITINTTGSLLRFTDIELFNIKYPNVKLVIGIDDIYGKVKGLNKLVSSRYEYGYESFISLLNINNKRLNAVLPYTSLSDPEVALELFTLSNLLDTNLAVMLDSTPDALKSINIDTAINLINLIIKLKYLFKDSKHKVLFPPLNIYEESELLVMFFDDKGELGVTISDKSLSSKSTISFSANHMILKILKKFSYIEYNFSDKVISDESHNKVNLCQFKYLSKLNTFKVHKYFNLDVLDTTMTAKFLI